MNSWSSRRKFIIFLIVFAVLGIVIGLPGYLRLHQAPSCFDAKQNGDEAGVDCGGSCKLICTSDSLPILTKGDPRVLQITSSTYDVVVTFENPNVSGEVLKAPYTLKLYDASSTLPIRTITSTTFVPRGSSFAIFQGPLFFEGIGPTRAVFSWGPLTWQKNATPSPKLSITDLVLNQTGIKPRVTATLGNGGLSSVSNIELVALVSDPEGNVVAASKTVVDLISPGESTPLVFTWPETFRATTSAVQILPRIFPR